MKLCICEVVDLPLWEEYPFKNGDRVLLLGEIEHMPDHVAVALKDGLVVFGYHAEHFRKLSEEEL